MLSSRPSVVHYESFEFLLFESQFYRLADPESGPNWCVTAWSFETANRGLLDVRTFGRYYAAMLGGPIREHRRPTDDTRSVCLSQAPHPQLYASSRARILFSEPT